MAATDAVTLAVYRGARDVARRGQLAKLIELEEAIVTAEHLATGIVKRALATGGPAYAGRVAESYAGLLDELAGQVAAERARIRHRIDVNYVDIPEVLRDFDHRVGAFQRGRAPGGRGEYADLVAAVRRVEDVTR